MRSRSIRVLSCAGTAALVCGLLTAMGTGTADAAGSGLQGDFNGDGYRDVVTAAPFATVDGKTEAGVVAVLYGSASGLGSARRTIISQNSAGVPGTVESSDWFGFQLATGDLNEDGFADVVTSAPLEDNTHGTNGGTVVILWGGSGGVSGGLTVNNGAPGKTIGQALAVGDFDSNGKDIAYGGSDPYVWIAKDGFTKTQHTGQIAGAQAPVKDGCGVTGLSAGEIDNNTVDAPMDDLIVTGCKNDSSGDMGNWYYEGTAGVPRNVKALPNGESTALGDLNRDGHGDIAIGNTKDPADDATSATGGKVTVLLGGPSGPDTTTARSFTQDSPGIPGSSEARDAFGMEMSIGDIDGDGFGELAIGVPLENIGDATDTGAAVVLRGSAAGPTETGIQYFTQNSTGVPGSNEDWDRFGSDILLSDLTKDGHAELIVAAHFENGGNGAMWSLPGSSAGINTSGSVRLSPSSLGISTAGRPSFAANFAG